MTQWPRVRRIVEDALERPPAERQAFVDAACADDPAIRSDVLSLLAAHQSTDEFLERPIFESAATLLTDEADRSLAGRRIGPYLIQQELGRGGMGVVYLADDTRLSRRVALKAIAPGLSHDPRRRDRLRQEARAAATVMHANVATVYALEEIDHELYLASEYVAGPTLRMLLKDGPLPAPQVVDIAVQLARALAAAHAQGVVHRDLKPDNVILTAAGVVKVLDFGIARVETLTDPGLTAAGDVVGTAGYMAPEQIRGQAVDFRADHFAFGVVVYELAAGANPFHAATRSATIAKVLEVEPAALSAASPANGTALDRIVATCLHKDPSARYASTGQLVRDLEALATGAGVSRPIRAEGPLESPAHAARSWWEINQVTIAAVEALLVIPAWLVHDWLPRTWGLAFVLAMIAVAAAATTIRLHLWFTSRMSPGELATERRRVSGWTRLCDASIVGVSASVGVAIAPEHDAAALFFVGTAIALGLAAVVIEPATTRAAFRE